MTGMNPDVAEHAVRFLPASRYRHPGDVIRLIVSGLVLAGTLAAVGAAHRRLLGPGTSAVTWLRSDPAGRLLTGLVQVAFVAAAAGIAAAALRHRPFRLLAGLLGGLRRARPAGGPAGSRPSATISTRLRRVPRSRCAGHRRGPRGDDRLAAEMHTAARAVMEERLIPALLADLASD